jgi:hypothetical protein
MKSKKNDLILIQNFSSSDFVSHMADLMREEIRKEKANLNQEDKEKYLTRKETARLLKISLTCLNDWCKKGILIPLKMGNRTYFKLSDIESKLNSSNNKID